MHLKKTNTNKLADKHTVSKVLDLGYSLMLYILAKLSATSYYSGVHLILQVTVINALRYIATLSDT